MIVHRYTKHGWLPALTLAGLRPWLLTPRDLDDPHIPIGSVLYLTEDGWMLRCPS